jgi:hypothetical protein
MVDSKVGKIPARSLWDYFVLGDGFCMPILEKLSHELEIMFFHFWFSI